MLKYKVLMQRAKVLQAAVEVEAETPVEACKYAMEKSKTGLVDWGKAELMEVLYRPINCKEVKE